MPEDLTSAQKKMAWLKKYRNTIFVACAVILLVLVGMPAYVTRQPEYYESLDGTKPYFQTWKTSTHEKMDCIDCHIESGAASLVLFEAKAVGEYYLRYILPEEVNFFGKPTRNACQECHTIYRVVSASGDLLIPHRAHVEVLKMSCSDCHQALVHTQNTRGINTPRMKMCLTCHNGHRASSKCRSCHTEKAYPQNHRATDWLEIHSDKTKEIDCAKCHAWIPDFCRECHRKRPKGHAGNWKKLHAVPAKQNSKHCLVCHEKKKCLNCHDKQMQID